MKLSVGDLFSRAAREGPINDWQIEEAGERRKIEKFIDDLQTWIDKVGDLQHDQSEKGVRWTFRSCLDVVGRMKTLTPSFSMCPGLPLDSEYNFKDFMEGLHEYQYIMDDCSLSASSGGSEDDGDDETIPK